MIADPRRVPDLALLMFHLSCKCVASELLGMQAPAFGWVQSQAGLTPAQAASALTGPVDVSKETHSRICFATGTAKMFSSFLHPGQKSFCPTTTFPEASLFLSIYPQVQREHGCRSPPPCQTAVVAAVISSFRQDVFTPSKQ